MGRRTNPRLAQSKPPPGCRNGDTTQGALGGIVAERQLAVVENNAPIPVSKSCLPIVLGNRPEVAPGSTGKDDAFQCASACPSSLRTRDRDMRQSGCSSPKDQRIWLQSRVEFRGRAACVG